MVLYAGIETDSIVATDEYLLCDGSDVLVSDYADLYNSLGKKFGYYPELTINAVRTAFNQLMYVYSYSETYYYVRHGNNFFSSGRLVLYRSYNGRVQFVPVTEVVGGIYTIACIAGGAIGGATTSSVKIISTATPTASFDNLAEGNYRFIISEQSTNSSSFYDTIVRYEPSVTVTTSSLSFGNYTIVAFTGSSNVAYSSMFKVTDNRTLQSATGYLRQSSPASIEHQVPATLVLPDNAPFTCSVIRYSGSYNDMPSASLAQSKNSITISGYNNSSLSLTSSIAATFFIPNMGDFISQELIENVPRNLSPTNADISSSGFDFAFRYLIKT
jgi:hypothetical protein